MKKKSLQGSYSIEASFILPFILSVIIILIYSSFYLYNCTLLHSAAYEAAIRGSKIQSEEKDMIAAETKKIGNELIRHKLLAMKNVSISVRVTRDSILVNYEGEFQTPGDVISSLLLREAYPVIRISNSVKRIDSVNFIRDCRRLEGLKEILKEEGEGKQ